MTTKSCACRPNQALHPISGTCTRVTSTFPTRLGQDVIKKALRRPTLEYAFRLAVCATLQLQQLIVNWLQIFASAALNLTDVLQAGTRR